METFFSNIKGSIINFFGLNNEQNGKILNLTPLEKSLIECKSIRDKTKHYITKLEKESIESKNKAKEYLKNNKIERAKFELKKKKMYDIQISNSEKQLLIISQKIIEIEKTQIESEVLKNLEISNKILLKLKEEVSVENWEFIGDEMAQIKMEQDEVINFFNKNNLNYEDNNDIDKEIEKMLNEEKEINENNINDSNINNNDKVFDLPDANKNEIVIDDNEKENDINQKKKLLINE